MIRPYVDPRPHRELAYLLDHEQALDETGAVVSIRDLLDRNIQVWADAGRLRELTRAGHGSCVLWRFAAIGWHPDRGADSWPVRGLQIDQPEPGAALRGLQRWRDWLESYGAATAGSLGGSGLSLLKATLERDLWTAAGDVPPIRYTLGGRQFTPPPTPRIERGKLRHCDMMAAYASTLGSVYYGGRWNHLEPNPARLAYAERNPSALVYARAVVDVPEMPWGEGPLPERPRSAPPGAAVLFWQLSDSAYPSGRRIQGTWSWHELEAAEAAGCRIVRILDLWIHHSGWQPFLPWFEAVTAGREMRGFAGSLAKATGNATWGQLAIAKGLKKVVARGRDQTLRLRGGNPSQRAFDLAEWIAGTVRAQLFTGMAAVADDLVCAHTDGLWTRGRAVPGWRIKRDRDADELRLVDAQHLSYRRARRSGGWYPWGYVVAGVLDPEEWFERHWQRYLDRGQVAA